MIEVDHKELSISQQCELLEKSRSWYYYKKKINLEKDKRDFKEKEKIRAIWNEHIDFGYRQVAYTLLEKKVKTSFKRVYRLMREMNLQAVIPKRNLSRPLKTNKKYPYLLRELKITRPNEVWACDITYVNLPGGTVFIVAIIDLFSRKILSWNISNTMDQSFVMDVLHRAMKLHGKPKIFNTDQGSQYTSREFTSCLKNAGILISMDGKGRALDNIYIERFWKTLKYHHIYLYRYESLKELRKGCGKFFRFYNEKRPHQSLGGKCPDKIYFGRSNLKSA